MPSEDNDYNLAVKLLTLLEQTLKDESTRPESEIKSVTLDGDHRSSEIFVTTKGGKNYIVMVLQD